ncbi:MAG TPA: cupin domain-containing protein [Thermoleophilaceae bacterium]
MAQGDVFELNDHERVTVRTSSADLLEMDAEWQPAKHRPLPHSHPSQDEHFEITEGQLSAKLGSETRVLNAGDTVDVPRGVVHTFWNSGTTTARARWQVRPAQRTEEFFRAVDSLRKQGHGTSAGVSPPAGALLAREFSAEFRPALSPVVRSVFLPALAAVAKRRGYKL